MSATKPQLASPAEALDVRALTIRYGDTTAVDAVSFRAGPGQVLGLLGPNGAGKTSLIRALTTVIEPTAGEAVVAGHRLSEVSSVRAAIGVLPESNGYPGGVDAPSYLRFFGQLYGLTRRDADARAATLLDRVGLGGERRLLAAFSRGMRQRLGLARSLVNSPRVLFLDEPTLGLDPAGKESIVGLLAGSAREDGTCVILCTHLLDEVERICDTVVILDHGRVVAEGTVGQVIAAAGRHRTLRMRIPPGQAQLVGDVLGRRGLGDVSSVASRPEVVHVGLAVGAEAADVLRALLDAGVEPTGFDSGSAQLADAFLTLTHRTEVPA